MAGRCLAEEGCEAVLRSSLWGEGFSGIGWGRRHKLVIKTFFEETATKDAADGPGHEKEVAHQIPGCLFRRCEIPKSAGPGQGIAAWA